MVNMVEIPEKKPKISEKEEQANFTKLSIKEVLDKIGFGFGSQQFINILLFQTGASYFLVGLINGLRVVFGNLAYFLIERFNKIRLNKRLISLSGIIFGFSFLLMAAAIYIHSVFLFSFAIIISSISVIIYGESKNLFKLSTAKNYLIEKIIKYSLIITAISLFIAAYLMDAFPASGTVLLLDIYAFLFSFKAYGYLIVFEVAAISFILAGYVLSYVKNETGEAKKFPFRVNFNLFVKNKALLLLVLTNMVIGLVQITGYSYYGIFIYQNFNNELFGGFLNVAMVFLISVFTSLIGYFIIKINAKVYRKFPILIFGVAMLAFMPFAYYLKPDLIFVTIATIIGVIGSSAVGVTNSLLAIDLVNFQSRQSYFSFTNLISIPFFLVMVPILAYIAQFYGLNTLFLILASILVAVIILLLAAYVFLGKELA